MIHRKYLTESLLQHLKMSLLLLGHFEADWFGFGYDFGLSFKFKLWTVDCCFSDICLDFHFYFLKGCCSKIVII